MSTHSLSLHELFRPFVERVIQRSTKLGTCIILAVTSPTEENGVTYITNGLVEAFREVLGERVKAVRLDAIRNDLRYQLALKKQEGLRPCDDVATNETLQRKVSQDLGGIRRSCLEQKAAGFDVVLVDSPPLSSSGDLLGFASSFDGIVIIISAGKTTRAQLARSESQLIEAGGTIEGHIFNQRRSSFGLMRNSTRGR